MSGSDPVYWMAIFSGGAVLAFITLKREFSLALSRFLAVTTTIAMFYYFAEFFMLAPQLSDGWYQSAGWQSGRPIHALSLLFSAFAMIPVLSDYSCRLKAECVEARIRERGAFFSVPKKLEKHVNLTR
jgi:hypothetical protein